MRVISYELARVTCLFPFEEIAPLGGSDGRAIVQGVTNRYSFSRPPNLAVSREEIDKNGLKFEGGRFNFEGEEVGIQTLAAYNDGINIDANNTDRAHAFLDDLISFLRSEYKFREFTTRPRIHFWNTVIVDFEKPISRLIEGHQKISAAISRSLTQAYGKEISPCVFSRLDFSGDATDRETPVPTPRFILERRAGISFSQERYYCAGPMRTHEHLQLLEAIERLAA